MLKLGQNCRLVQLQMKIFKRIVLFLLLGIVLLTVIFTIQNYPAYSNPKNFPLLSDTNHIKKSLEFIINTPRTRNYKNVEALDTVAERIRQEFLQHTNRVAIQEYRVLDTTYRNIMASFGPEDGERIIVGAHYDVCGDQDGADDNASGVAGILELAKLLKETKLKYRIDLVAYTLEEPPFFDTKNMGSYVHAKSLHDADIPVKGMVSLEMIGYYAEEEGSQTYPVGILKWVYGSKGDYITIAQNSFCGKFAKEYKEIAFDNNSIPTKCFRSPSFLGGVRLSDHMNYWDFGYSAVMITNTAFFRNHNYHKKTDTRSTLNIAKMAGAIDGVYRTLTQLQ